MTYDVDTFALGGVLGFDDPVIRLLLIPQRVEMRIKVRKLIGQDIAIRYDIKFLFTMLFLHLDQIRDQSIFPCQLVREREMINLLVLLKLFVYVRLYASR